MMSAESPPSRFRSRSFASPFLGGSCAASLTPRCRLFRIQPSMACAGQGHSAVADTLSFASGMRMLDGKEAIHWHPVGGKTGLRTIIGLCHRLSECGHQARRGVPGFSRNALTQLRRGRRKSVPYRITRVQKSECWSIRAKKQCFSSTISHCGSLNDFNDHCSNVLRISSNSEGASDNLDLRQSRERGCWPSARRLV